MNTSTRTVVAAIAGMALLAIGIATGAWWAGRTKVHVNSAMPAAAATGERKVLYWYDPMVPDQHFDHPGKSPFMDMQLLPKYDEAGTGAGVRIDPGLQQSVGVRTAVVQLGRLSVQRRVPGSLTWDLRRESIVSAPVDAIVARVFVKTPFEAVRAGQPLASILAPEWTTAIAEARALDQGHSAASRELRSASRQRLRALGIPAAATTASGVPLTSPQSGVVSEVLVREGQALSPGTPMFRVNGTDTLWLEASIPQADAASFPPGTAVEASVNGFPGVGFSGEVDAVLPQVEGTSKTLRARVILRNDDHRLVPGMLAEVGLKGQEGPQVPLVPTEALISTGSENRVIVADKDGAFHPVAVRIGRSAGGRVEVLSGLSGGERVVTSGQFLIDSEASLSGSLQRMDEPQHAHKP